MAASRCLLINTGLITPSSPASVRSSAYRSHHHAAAGMDVLARQPTRLFAHHKGYDGGDVIRRAKSLERRGLLAGLAEGGIGGHHGSVCGTGGNPVFGGPPGGKVRCGGLSGNFAIPPSSEGKNCTLKSDIGYLR